MTSTPQPEAAPRPHRAWYAGAALLAAAAGAGAGHLVAGLVSPEASPVLAVGSTVIDATPTPVKEWAVSTFGTADKAILVGSVSVVTLVLAAAAGVLARRHRTAGLAVIGVIAMLAVVAAVLRPTAQPVDLLPGLVTALVGVFGASWLLGSLDRMGAADADPAAGAGADRTGRGDGTSGRRTVLVAAAGLGAVAAAGGGIGQALVRRGGSAEVVLPTPAQPLAPLPQGLEEMVRGVSSFRTPNDAFYRIDTALVLPRVDAGSWELTVDGMVDKPFTLTFDELLGMPMIEKDVTLTCVSNEIGGPYVGGARWLGVRVRDLLERAGVQDGVDQIFSTSTDGMTISTPVQALMDDRDALVAVGMNGQPLPRAHGFPARLVTPGLYGFVGATKWLTKLTATHLREGLGLLDRPRVGHRRADLHREPDRHPEAALDPEGRPDRHRRRGLGPAARHRQGRGAGRRRPLDGGQARPGRRCRLLAPVVPALGRRPRPAHARGPSHRRDRPGPDREPPDPLPQGRHGLALGDPHRGVTPRRSPLPAPTVRRHLLEVPADGVVTRL